LISLFCYRPSSLFSQSERRGFLPSLLPAPLPPFGLPSARRTGERVVKRVRSPSRPPRGFPHFIFRFFFPLPCVCPFPSRGRFLYPLALQIRQPLLFGPPESVSPSLLGTYQLRSPSLHTNLEWLPFFFLSCPNPPPFPPDRENVRRSFRGLEVFDYFFPAPPPSFLPPLLIPAQAGFPSHFFAEERT